MDAAASADARGTLFTQVPADLLLGKVVNRSRALSVGAGFKMLGYCRLGNAVGKLELVSACGIIL